MTTAEGIVAADSQVTVRISIRTWSLVVLVLYLISGAAFAGFTLAGGIWFTISDAVGLFLGTSMLVVVVQYDRLLRPLIGSLSLTARRIGVVGMGIAIAGSIVLLSSQAGHVFVPGGGGLGMQFAGWGLLGIWFLLIGGMILRTQILTHRVAIAAYVAGAGSVLAMIATIPLGSDSPAVSLGFTATFVAIVFWVIWSRQET